MELSTIKSINDAISLISIKSDLSNSQIQEATDRHVQAMRDAGVSNLIIDHFINLMMM